MKTALKVTDVLIFLFILVIPLFLSIPRPIRFWGGFSLFVIRLLLLTLILKKRVIHSWNFWITVAVIVICIPVMFTPDYVLFPDLFPDGLRYH